MSTRFKVWANEELAARGYPYRVGAQHAFQWGALRRLLGEEPFKYRYVRGDCRKAERDGWDAMSNALRTGTTFTCDQCHQGIRGSTKERAS